jgi:two-component system, OmpR family, alkaline phosphatase synthesis response regulator PhoP
MPNVLLIVKEVETGKKLQNELAERGFAAAIATNRDKIIERVIRESPELVMVEMNGFASQSVLHELTHTGKIKSKMPIMALVNVDSLTQPGDFLGVDDFVLRPYDIKELTFRAKRLLQRNTNQEEILHLDDLTIDLANCEVRVDGKVVELTFKEYELLKFLAKDRGRVYTREALLNKVWGYDYFGGDRTVDVHVRRLRSKIELSGQTFIETVRNIGYRFKKGK